MEKLKFIKDVWLLFYYIFCTSISLRRAEKTLDKDIEFSQLYYRRAKAYHNKHKRKSDEMNKYRVWRYRQ